MHCTKVENGCVAQAWHLCCVNATAIVGATVKGSRPSVTTDACGENQEKKSKQRGDVKQRLQRRMASKTKSAEKVVASNHPPGTMFD